MVDICAMQVDYLIIGQGLCGSFLSRYLLEAGCSVLVMDQPVENSASRIASGIINPVTGRRLVRTWEIEQLMPFAWEAYSSWGEQLQQSLIRNISVLDFPPTPSMLQAFEERAAEDAYLQYPVAEDEWKAFFNFIFPPGLIEPALSISIGTLLTAWRKELENRQSIRSAVFEWNDLRYTDSEIRYRDIIAKKIIFCDGVNGQQVPCFQLLPFAPNKGEVIWARIPDLPDSHIYKLGIHIVPWEGDVFWIGSSYEWNFTHDQPTESFRKQIEQTLQKWLRVNFQILDHRAAIRPANLERRPFVGLHPHYPSLGILNGMGTKGCSLAPWFARELANHLLLGTPIHPQADMARFTKILGRNSLE